MKDKIIYTPKFLDLDTYFPAIYSLSDKADAAVRRSQERRRLARDAEKARSYDFQGGTDRSQP